MVNTVGSYENINWQKKWTLIKRSLTITSQQRTLIVGSLLGDGTMRVGENAINANFKIEHGLKQREYVEWKYKILEPLVFTRVKMSYRYQKNGEKYAKSWWFRTLRHPLLTKIYKRFYKGNGYKTGNKIIPRNIKKDLNPFALAVWVMDDGSYKNRKIDISTYAFSLSGIKILQKAFRDNFYIKIKYYKDRDKGYRLYCNQQETKKLIEIIYPYIIPSMMYKIGFRNPVMT